MDELILKNVTKRYPGVVALNNVSVSFRQGEIHALIGENGAGKSTMIKIITGAIRPDEGTITISGKEHSALTPTAAMDAGISAVYQEMIQMESMSVTDNIFMSDYGAREKKLFLDKAEHRKRTQEHLAAFGVDIDPDAAVGSLSMACRQVVEISKAVSKKAKIVIFDEPTASLTAEEQESLFKIIRKLKADGVSIIYISHRLDEIFEICDRVTVLRDGQYITTRDVADTNKQDLISLMVGRELKEIYPEHGTDSDEIVLRAENMAGPGVNGVSFELKRGEILGFAGLVGAGRTELMNLIYGATKKASGDLFLNGQKVVIRSPADALAKKIGLIPEDRKGSGCFLDQKIQWNISISNIRELSKLSFFNSRKEREQALEYIELLKIKTPSADQRPANLSGGNQQKVVLAKAIAAHSDILIFDEPTRGVDVGARSEIYNLMVDLVHQGKSILMVSSDMEELLGMSDRIIVLHEGDMMGELQKSEFSQNRVLEMASGM